MERDVKKRLKEYGVAFDDSTVVWDETIMMRELSVITASEAAWHILRYPLSGCTHVVTPLSVHEEFNESVLFPEGLEDEAAQRLRDAEATSALTAWFKANEVRMNDPIKRFRNTPKRGNTHSANSRTSLVTIASTRSSLLE